MIDFVYWVLFAFAVFCIPVDCVKKGESLDRGM